MNKKFNFEYIHDLLNKTDIEAGLYIIATPIGNLSDITIRALNILATSNIIYCEDTRVSKKLTSKYGINSRMKSFHKFNSKIVIPEIIKRIENNEIVSLISDAGTPLISDPGNDLTNEFFKKKLKFYSIPGSNSVIAGLVASGMPTSSFTFYGFVPRIRKEKNALFKTIDSSSNTSIFFESPKRIKSTINSLREIMKIRRVSIVRELTKKNEEVISGDINQVYIKICLKKEIKGELTIIVEPAKKINALIDDIFLIRQIEKKLKKNYSLSEISLEFSDIYNVSKRRVYQLGLSIKNKY